MLSVSVVRVPGNLVTWQPRKRVNTNETVIALDKVTLSIVRTQYGSRDYDYGRKHRVLQRECVDDALSKIDTIGCLVNLNSQEEIETGCSKREGW